MNVEKFADSWIDVKGNDYQIVENTGSYLPRSEDGSDGFQTHVLDKEQKYGRGNIFAKNTIDIGDATGYGIKIHKKSDDSLGNIVCDNNSVSGAEAGVANIDISDNYPIE